MTRPLRAAASSVTTPKRLLLAAVFLVLLVAACAVAYPQVPSRGGDGAPGDLVLGVGCPSAACPLLVVAPIVRRLTR